MPKAEYKNAIRSKRMIREALLELVKEKDASKITVTDIVMRADINRGTFYAHYENMDSLFRQISDEIIGVLISFIDEIEYRDFVRNPRPLFDRATQVLEENREYCQQLMTLNGSEQYIVQLQHVFIRYIREDESIRANVRKKPDFEILITFFAGGLASAYSSWIRGELACTGEELAAMLTRLTKQILRR